ERHHQGADRQCQEKTRLQTRFARDKIRHSIRRILSRNMSEQKKQQQEDIALDDAAVDDVLEETAACLGEGQEGGSGSAAGGVAAGGVDPSAKKRGPPGGFFKMPKTPTLKAPKVAGKRVTLERNQDEEQRLDVISRDPNGLNKHCKIQFEDIIAEPDPTVFSFDSVWTISYKVFTTTKLWCYRISSLICAIPAAICWGIEFACLSFCTIWCWQPSIKAYEISLWYTSRIYEVLLKAFMEPCFHAIGKMFSHIVVNVRQSG
ncbi:hypothetical protein BOX15_Mlig010275g2, partial [Macrostomum lignano]